MSEVDFDALVSGEGGGGAGSGVGSVRVYDDSGYWVTLRLSDFLGADIVEREDEEGGEPERGLFIPLRRNSLLVTNRREVYATFKMEAAQISSRHHTHLLSQVLDRTVLEERRRLGYKSGFVGFAKPVGYGSKSMKKMKI